MAEDNLNDEVIKIFIESLLVKHEGFTLMKHAIERSFNGYSIGFRLNVRQLELFTIDDNKVLERVQIVDMAASECITFAKQAYMILHRVICEIEKNH
jgi:hypothetical protein